MILAHMMLSIEDMDIALAFIFPYFDYFSTVRTKFLSYKKEQPECHLTSPHKPLHLTTLLLAKLKWLSLMDRVLYHKAVMVTNH